MINMNKKLIAILLVCAVLIGAGGAIILMSNGVGGVRLLSESEFEVVQGYMDRYHDLDVLRQSVMENYYTEVDEQKLLDGAYKGLVSGLGDAYSEYVSPEDVDSFNNNITGEFYGIGVSFFANEKGGIEIESVHIDSPAEKGGLLAGDVIIKVDDQSIVGMSTTEAQMLIRGEKDTEVKIGYLRNGTEGSTVLKRAKISDISVASALQPDGIGYIRIYSFGSSTGKEFAKHLSDMENQGAKAIIVDLRNNGGGLVDSAIEVADALMNKGTVAYALKRDGSKETYTVEDGRTKLPYAILVNGYTASASEILSIGVKDNKEGIIVGTKTYGKGIIQVSMGIVGGAVLKITYMEYYSPSGETIHKVGVEPDYVVELPYDATSDYQYDKAAELLLSK